MSKETFKLFAKNHPELAYEVINGKTTWQKLYELFDIYGENSSIWSQYTTDINSSSTSVVSTFKDFFNTVRNVDLDSVQKGVNNLQKTIGLLQEIGIGNSTTKDIHEPRPMYKYFED